MQSSLYLSLLLTSASTPTGDGGSVSPTSAAGESTAASTDGEDSSATGKGSESATSGFLDLGPPVIPECGGGTIEPPDGSEFAELWGAFDTSALVVRNDQLAQPRDFVTDGARWIVWSNHALTCDAPLDAPLCAGEWRISVAVSASTWCEIRVNDGFGWTIHYSGAVAPLFVEVGDADCKTERFMLADESLALVGFITGEDQPPATPQPMESCADAPLPGTDISPNGTFTAQICL